MYSLNTPITASQTIGRRVFLLLGVGTVAALSACGKSDRVPTTADRLSSVQQKQQTQPDFYIPRKTVDYMTDLKSIKDAPARTEPAPAKAEPASKSEPKSASPEKNVAVAPTAAPAPQAAPTQSPSDSAPPGNVVASSVPTARPPAPKQDAGQAVTVVSREQPAFPREALRAGIDNGTVRARLTINATGDVTNVAIVQAQPPRVFDRSVQQALGRWKFNAGSEGRTFETEVGFRAN